MAMHKNSYQTESGCGMQFVCITLPHLACTLVTAAQTAFRSSDSALSVLQTVCADVTQTQIIHAFKGKKDVALKSWGDLS